MKTSTKTVEQQPIAYNHTSYGLFIDLNFANSIQEAIQFDNEHSYDAFVINLKSITSNKLTYEVGIKYKDGTIETETFDQFKKRFFN